jgi:hypothetical protein
MQKHLRIVFFINLILEYKLFNIQKKNTPE